MLPVTVQASKVAVPELSTPPPSEASRLPAWLAKLSASVLSVSVAVPLLNRPPPPSLAVLPERVLSVMVSTALFWSSPFDTPPPCPPPLLPVAVLPERVLSVIVAVPVLYSPPPVSALLPLTVQPDIVSVAPY